MTDVEISSTARSDGRKSLRTALCLTGSVVTVVATVVLPATGEVGASPLSDARAHASTVNSQIQADASRLDVLDEQYQVALQKVQALRGQISQDHATVVQDQSTVVADQADLRRQALDAYMSGTADSSLESIFGSTGVNAAATSEYKSLANGNMSNAVDDLGLAEQRLTAQEATLQGTEDEAQAALAIVASARQSAAATLANEQALLRSVNANILAQERQAAEAAAYQSYLSRLAQSHGGTLAVAPGASGAVQAAESQIGVPYEWGAESPGVGFDCSGLTQWAWRQAGVGIPRTAEEQMQAIPSVPLSDLQPGDLVFWGSGGYADHVGMYVGNGDVVHAPSSGETVRIQAIWGNGLLGAGRP